MRISRPISLLSAAVLLVALTGSARAGSGDPSLASCIANGGTGGCAALPQGSLTGASGLAVSPDGRNLYTTSYGVDTVSGFGIGPGGALGFGGCVANGGAGGCDDPSGDALGGPAEIVVSPGGGDVYVAAGLGAAVTRLHRDPGSGALSFATCTSNGGAHGCETALHPSLAGATALTLSAGGGDVYVTSVDAAAVSHLVRAANGDLEMHDCVADEGHFGCTAPPGKVLEGASAITISPDDRNVYVASYTSGSISRFSRNAVGRLTYRGCVADGGANGCRKLNGHRTLLGVAGIAISEDGSDLYIASQIGAVSRFAISKTGSLKLTDCIADGGVGHCRRPTHNSLAEATGIAVGPNGRDIYVASRRADSITHLIATPGGELRFRSCIAGAGAHRCRRTRATALDGAYALALAPGGRRLFGTAALGAAVSSFELDQFAILAVKQHPNKGTATVIVRSPGAGRLTMTGKGVGRRVRRPGGLQRLALVVRPRGRALASLDRSGHATVRVKLSFLPLGGGRPGVLQRRIRLSKASR